MPTTPAVIMEMPDRAAIAAENTGIVQRAHAFLIQNKADDEEAKLIFQELTRRERTVEGKLDPIIAEQHRAHKSLTSLKAELLAPIKEAKGIITGKVIVYEDAERRKAEAEARRLQELARQAEEERALAEAIEAEQAGDKAAAEEIIAKPVSAPVVHVEAQVAQVAGVSGRSTWGAEVYDMPALIRHVAANLQKEPALAAALEASMPYLNAKARTEKGLMQLPGVRAVERKGLSGRLA